jgi:hypothetical protein
MTEEEKEMMTNDMAVIDMWQKKVPRLHMGKITKPPGEKIDTQLVITPKYDVAQLRAIAAEQQAKKASGAPKEEVTQQEEQGNKENVAPNGGQTKKASGVPKEEVTQRKEESEQPAKKQITKEEQKVSPTKKSDAETKSGKIKGEKETKTDLKKKEDETKETQKEPKEEGVHAEIKVKETIRTKDTKTTKKEQVTLDVQPTKTTLKVETKTKTKPIAKDEETKEKAGDDVVAVGDDVAAPKRQQARRSVHEMAGEYDDGEDEEAFRKRVAKTFGKLPGTPMGDSENFDFEKFNEEIDRDEYASDAQMDQLRSMFGLRVVGNGTAKSSKKMNKGSVKKSGSKKK